MLGYFALSEGAVSAGTQAPQREGLHISGVANVAFVCVGILAAAVTASGSSEVNPAHNQATPAIAGSSGASFFTYQRAVALYGTATLSPVAVGHFPAACDISGATALSVVLQTIYPSASAIDSVAAVLGIGVCTANTRFSAYGTSAFVGCPRYNAPIRGVVRAKSLFTPAPRFRATATTTITGGASSVFRSAAISPAQLILTAGGALSGSARAIYNSTASISAASLVAFAGRPLSGATFDIAGAGALAVASTYQYTPPLTLPEGKYDIAFIYTAHKAIYVYGV